ncbi:hypothetical protein [Geodermatophilus sp. SYSU D00815]
MGRDDAPQRGEIGWPAPPRKGELLGWPGDLTVDDRADGRLPSPPVGAP